jgi:hypothetical protein
MASGNFAKITDNARRIIENVAKARR